MIFGFVSKKKYDELKEKYDSEYYKAEAALDQRGEDIFQRYVKTEEELIILRAKYSEEVCKNFELSEKLKLIEAKKDD